MLSEDKTIIIIWKCFDFNKNGNTYIVCKKNFVVVMGHMPEYLKHVGDTTRWWYYEGLNNVPSHHRAVLREMLFWVLHILPGCAEVAGCPSLKIFSPGVLWSSWQYSMYKAVQNSHQQAEKCLHKVSAQVKPDSWLDWRKEF